MRTLKSSSVVCWQRLAVLIVAQHSCFGSVSGMWLTGMNYKCLKMLPVGIAQSCALDATVCQEGIMSRCANWGHLSTAAVVWMIPTPVNRLLRLLPGYEVSVTSPWVVNVFAFIPGLKLVSGAFKVTAVACCHFHLPKQVLTLNLTVTYLLPCLFLTWAITNEALLCSDC